MASHSRSRPVRRVVTTLFVAGVSAGLWACWWREPPPLTMAKMPDRMESAAGTAGELTADDSPLPSFLEDELRSTMTPGQSDVPNVDTSDAAGFDELLEQLVEIAVAANHSVKADDRTEIARLDESGRAILARILYQVEDPDYLALFKLTGLPSEDTTIRGTARRQLCLGILRRGLDRKLASFETGGSRKPLDHLVATMLDSIPQDEMVAQDFAKQLTCTKFLGVAHESAVLDLVALAAEERYLMPWVTGILETLWDNLQAEGARTSEELIHLALMFREDANRAKRLVALRHLLVAGDGRYRDLVLHEVMSTRDEELAAELTMTAATKLPPRKAIAALERLSMVTTRQLMPAFLTLGERDPQILYDAYEQKLADGVRPDYRKELVTGAGFRGGAVGLKIAQLAFDYDPDSAVRARALFAITGQAGAVEGEKYLMAALDDPAFADRSAGLGQVVLALENMVAAGNPNAVDRVGQRLRSMPDLGPDDRRRLEKILDRAVPTKKPPRGRSQRGKLRGKHRGK